MTETEERTEGVCVFSRTRRRMKVDGDGREQEEVCLVGVLVCEGRWGGSFDVSTNEKESG